MIGTTNIALGATGSTLAGLTSVAATTFTGALTGNASTATSASFASTASFLNGGTTNAFIQNGNSFGTTALLGTNDNQPLAFETNGSTRMFISSSGNVGIGTTSPNEKLEVNGNIKYTSTVGSTATPSYIWLGNDYSNGSTRDKLKVYLYNSGTEQYGFTVGAAADVQYHSNGKHDFYIANSPTVRIESTGVGIGTTSLASYKLNVAGGQYGTYLKGGDLGTGSDILRLVDASNNTKYVARGDGKHFFTGDTDIVGTLTATVKSFIIDHPTKEGKKLQYGVLEGPEHSVYVRGKLTNNNTIQLPDHWTGLVHEDTITVNLTPIGKRQDLWVETVSDTTITVGSGNEINCFYTVFAERKDIEKLVTEFDK